MRVPVFASPGRWAAALVSLLTAVPVTVHAQAARADTAALIASALRAAPAGLARHATVVDLQQKVLRQGESEWMCLPDDPAQPGDAPMCLDQPWVSFIGAYLAKRPPAISRVGFGYMLQGDLPVSNTDPFATGPTEENQWIDNSGPHVMILLPDPAALAGLPTDPANGGPWVMWKGTPYAHIMVPVPRRGE